MLDRVIQQAFAQVLGPLFEADFSEYSHGLPSLRSGHASQGFAIRPMPLARQARSVPAAQPFRRWS